VIREALPGELSEWPTAEAGEVAFVIDRGDIHGFACLSRVSVPSGEQCWLHDCYHFGEDPLDFAELALRVRAQAREWGYSEVYTNVRVDSPMFGFWQKQGFAIEQYVMKGYI
jgi:hypothetical protein